MALFHGGSRHGDKGLSFQPQSHWAHWQPPLPLDPRLGGYHGDVLAPRCSWDVKGPGRIWEEGEKLGPATAGQRVKMQEVLIS